MPIEVTPTGAFLRNLKKLSKADCDNAISALETFVEDPKAKSLNFEAVKSRSGYFSIRSNYKTRILLKLVGSERYEVVAVGNHDFVYASYFRK